MKLISIIILVLNLYGCSGSDETKKAAVMDTIKECHKVGGKFTLGAEIGMFTNTIIVKCEWAKNEG